MDEDDIKAFNACWVKTEKTGGCDGFGGMEYERVKREWDAAGKPENIAEFIIERANVLVSDAHDMLSGDESDAALEAADDVVVKWLHRATT